MTATTAPTQVTAPTGGRHYEIDGVRYPSVTTILKVVNKPALVPWAKKVALEKVREELQERVTRPAHAPTELDDEWLDEVIAAAKKRTDEIRDEAASIGTRSHEVIEDFLKTGELPLSKIDRDIVPVIESFTNWWYVSGLKFHASEMVVVSKVHGYAGTLDVVAIDERGEHCVIDIKTSNGIYPEMAMQVAAYAFAYESMALEHDTGRCYVVRLGKNKSEFEVKEVDVWRSFEGFQGAMRLFEALEGKKLWR